MLNALTIVIIGVVCAILAVVSIVLTIVWFSNNKPNKYVWLTTFFIGLVGAIICFFLFVRKVMNKVHSISENTISQIGNYTDSLSTNHIEMHQANISSTQIELLKSYPSASLKDKEPAEFYTYLGFQDYYRYPLCYPYSIHRNYYDEGNGELYNELNVTRFDENDNGEIYAGISYISKIAFDKNYLLIEQSIISSRTDKRIKHYLLFTFNKEKTEEVKSEKELFRLAKEKGYTGADSLMTLEQYYKLFQ